MLTRQRAKSSAAAPAVGLHPRQADRQQEGRSTRSSSKQPAAAARKRTHAAAEASNHGSNTSSIAAAQHDPGPNKRSTAHTQQPGERLPALMRVLAAYQPLAHRATRSAAAAAAAAATAIQQMALAAPDTLTQALLAEPSYLSTLLAAALDSSSGAEAAVKAAAGALLALASAPALQHRALLEALTQQQHLQLIVNGMEQDSAFAAWLVSQLVEVPAAQALLQQHTGIFLHMCLHQAASAAVQSAAAMVLISHASTAAGRQALQQHNLASLLAGMADGGSSAVAAAGIVHEVVFREAAHEVLLPYVAELMAAVNPQHAAHVGITPDTVTATALAVHQIAIGSAAGRQAVMQHAGGLFAAVQQVAQVAALQPAAAVTGSTLLFLLESEGGLQAFSQQVQQQQQQGQLGHHLLALLQLMDQEGMFGAVLRGIYNMILDTPEGQQALLPHIAELLHFAQRQCSSTQQSLMAVVSVAMIAGSEAAGGQAVLQHVEVVRQLLHQQLAAGRLAVANVACRVVVQLPAAAAQHEQQQRMKQHVQTAVDVLLQLLQHEDAHTARLAASSLQRAAEHAECKQLLAAPQRMAVILDTIEPLQQLRVAGDLDDGGSAHQTFISLLWVVRLVVEHACERQEVPAFVPRVLNMLKSSQDADVVVGWAFAVLCPLATFKQGRLALLPVKGHLQYFVGEQPSSVLDDLRTDRPPFNLTLGQMLAALDAAMVQLQQDQQQAQLALQQAGVAAAQVRVQHRAQRQCVQLQAEFVAQLQQLDAASTHNQQLKQLLHAASVPYKP